ncbi:MAG: hypothetical protein AB8H80_23310 [Planctomycetota bacterium]
MTPLPQIYAAVAKPALPLLVLLLGAMAAAARALPAQTPTRASTAASSPRLRPSQQDPQTPPPQNGVPNLAALALRVGRSHRPEAGPGAAAAKPIDAFRCSLALELLDKRAEQGGQVELAVQFLRWQRENNRRKITLLRYELQGSEGLNVRGRDRLGPWHVQQGEVQDLTGARHERDLEQFREHLNLAKQLVRFLSPEEVLKSLKKPSEVTRTQLVIARGKSVATLTVTGTLKRFPMMQNAGEEGPALLQIYVDESNDRLRAVDVWPLVEGKPDLRRCERIVMNDQRMRDGILVAHELTHKWRDPNGRLRPHSRVKMTTLDLRPELTVSDFDRRK